MQLATCYDTYDGPYEDRPWKAYGENWRALMEKIMGHVNECERCMAKWLALYDCYREVVEGYKRGSLS